MLPAGKKSSNSIRLCGFSALSSPWINECNLRIRHPIASFVLVLHYIAFLKLPHPKSEEYYKFSSKCPKPTLKKQIYFKCSYIHHDVHDNVIKMETFSALLALCEGNPPVTKGHWIPLTKTSVWCFLWSAPEQGAGDLRRNHDVNVMLAQILQISSQASVLILYSF